MTKRIQILTKRQVLLLHRQMAALTGGSVGLRDEGLLESALSAPFQSFGGYSPYPTVMEKAARLGFSLIRNHPFVDGNKRIGVHVMLTLLGLNGVTIESTQQELAETVLAVAAGEMAYEDLLAWLEKHIA